MKNVKRLLVATAALLSASSMALLIQPGMPSTEDAPFRVTVAANGGLVKAEKGFGFNNLSGGLGLLYNFGYDVEGGLAVAGGWATPESSQKDSYSQRVFSEEAEKGNLSGFRLETELMARFMPEVAEKLRVGGVLGIGWGSQFKREDENKDIRLIRDATKFGDLSLRVGPAVAFGLTEMVGLYFNPAYTLTAIRFADSEKVKVIGEDNFKKITNLSGVELPLGVWVGAGENVGVFLEVNNKFRSFENLARSWKMDLTLGVSVAI